MEKVKKLRKEVGMSQIELVRLLGVRQSHYSSLENGHCYPKKDKEKTKEMAVEILYPLLIKKIIAHREELERLESFSLQFRNHN